MLMKVRIKKGDTVVVVAGKDKKKTGEVLQVLPKESRVIVKDVNVVKKHQKPTQASAGGIVEKEKSIHISNVALLDSKTQKPTKIGYKIENDKKVRFAKKSGTVL
jgi:large subunit ribosomal protein L24